MKTEFITSKANRLFLVLNLIRSRRNPQAKDLGLECEVSEWFIYRDIKAIFSANISITFEEGHKFLTDVFSPLLNFILDEYLALYPGLNSEIINSNLASSPLLSMSKIG